MTDTSTRTGSFDTLLEQEQWLYSLARHLTVDDASARDLVQQTLVAALENPPRDRALRPWLATVVRRMAGKARLRRVPQLGDLQDSLAEGLSPVDAAQLSEAKTRLRDAVAGLEESLRVTVHLSYVNGLSRAEIASALGVTERTVRNRLRASYVHIRYSLGSDFQDDGQTPAWGAALAPLLGHQARLRSVTVPTFAGVALKLVGLLAAAVISFLLIDATRPQTEDRAGRVVRVLPAQNGPLTHATEAAELAPTKSPAPVREPPPASTQTALDAPPEITPDAAAESIPPVSLEPRFRVRGTVLIDGSVPDGYEAYLTPMGRMLTHGSIPNQRAPLGGDGFFEVAAAETGHWILLIRPQERRGGSPVYRLHLELAPGSEEQEVALDVATGNVLVTAEGHAGLTLWLWAPSNSWEFISAKEVKDGTVAFEMVPDGEFTVRFKQNDDLEELDEYQRLLTGWVNAGETTDIRVPKPR